MFVFALDADRGMLNWIGLVVPELAFWRKAEDRLKSVPSTVVLSVTV